MHGLTHKLLFTVKRRGIIEAKNIWSLASFVFEMTCQVGRKTSTQSILNWPFLHVYTSKKIHYVNVENVITVSVFRGYVDLWELQLTLKYCQQSGRFSTANLPLRQYRRNDNGLELFMHYSQCGLRKT